MWKEWSSRWILSAAVLIGALVVSAAEGGTRVPTLFWWPGQLEAGKRVTELSSTLDLLPTFAALAGTEPPSDRVLDGYDLTAMMFDGQPTPRENLFYYSNRELHAVRSGPFKAHLFTHGRWGGPGPKERQRHDPPLLYNLEQDPSEQYEIGDKHPEVIARIKSVIEAQKATYQD